MSRFREFDVSSKDAEDAIFETMEELCNIAYQDRKISDRDADDIIDIANDEIGKIMDQFERFMGRERYAVPKDIEDFSLKMVNQIIREIGNQRNRRDSRNDRDRDYGRSGSRDRESRMRFSDDRDTRRSSSFGLAGGRGNDKDRNERDDVRNTPERKRAQIASEASQRQRQREKEIGQGKVNDDTSVPVQQPLQRHRRLPEGVKCVDNFAIIGKLGEECPIAIATLDNPPSPSRLYNNIQHTNILVDNAINVDMREIHVQQAFGNVYNMVNFLREHDNLLLSPDDYCHLIHFPKVTLAKIPALGIPLLEASAEVKKILQEPKNKDIEMIETLSLIASTLNQVSPKIRTAVMNRVLRKWNTVSKCMFCLPESPDSYLEAAVWEHLLRFCAVGTSTATDDISVSIREKIEFFTDMKGTQFSRKLHGVMEDVLTDLYQGNNGFIDIRKEHLEYITGWDELSICIDNQYRPRDILKMNDDQRKSLAAQFMKDYCCMIEDMTVIITNLNVNDMTVHAKTNHVAAIDIPTVQVLRNIMDKSTRAHLLYNTTDNGGLNYIGHCGNSIDNAVQLVVIKDSY